jgi:hypothetical protein
VSAISDEREWREGFYLGASDHRQHRPHRDEHGQPPQHRVGYEDGWAYDGHRPPQVPATYESIVVAADFESHAGDLLNEERGR